MNKNRLLVLAGALDEQHNKEPHQFDYGYWRHKVDYGCGATYCAFGLAASLPEFNKEGLHFNSPIERFLVNIIVLDGFTPDTNGVGFHIINQIVASKFFEITLDEVRLLFIPGSVLKSETTGKEVARLLRYFVENGSVQGFKSVDGCENYCEE